MVNPDQAPALQNRLIARQIACLAVALVAAASAFRVAMPARVDRWSALWRHLSDTLDRADSVDCDISYADAAPYVTVISRTELGRPFLTLCIGSTPIELPGLRSVGKHPTRGAEHPEVNPAR